MNRDTFQAIAIGKNTQSKNIFYNLNGNIIKTEDEAKLLGVIIDYELKGVSMIRVDIGPISETVYIDIILNPIIER